jgi:hypothetical protein
MTAVERRWDGGACIVAATGPSLTKQVAAECERALAAGWRVIAVNDAYKLLPFADVLYACDQRWWEIHLDGMAFAGERWTSHHANTKQPEKVAFASVNGLRLVGGQHGPGFSLDPSRIHYGNLSGFQAINLAILFGCVRIVLVGMDMHTRNGRHFFGNHPRGLNNGAHFEEWVPLFTEAARLLPAGIRIVNATPGSALTCWPMVDLIDALAMEPA